MILQLLDQLGIGSDGLLGGLRSLAARAGLAAVLAFVTALVTGPALLRWLHGKRYIEKEVKGDSKTLDELSASKAPTPTMGGLMIVGAILAAGALCGNLQNFYVQIALLSTLGYGLIGFFDDWVKLTRPGRSGLRSLSKYLLQLGIAISVAIGITLVFERLGSDLSRNYPEEFPSNLAQQLQSLHVPFTDLRIDLSFAMAIPHIVLVLIVVTGTSNAVNLSDGMDGLAAGCVTVAALAMGALCVAAGRAPDLAPDRIFYSPHSQELAVFCTAMAGATLGFLWFNAPPALVYMGDTGSLPLGSLLGYVSVVVKQELVFLIVGGVFVIEALSVILQVGVFKATGGRRVFRCAPVHHHFQFAGVPDTRIVTRFWILSILFAAAGLASLAAS